MFEKIFGMITVDVAVVRGFDSSGFFGLFFRILNFFPAFLQLIVFRCNCLGK